MPEWFYRASSKNPGFPLNSPLGKDHKAQLFHYLKTTNLRLGLLVNFGHTPKFKLKE
jgi:hypothetical protein